MKAVSCVFACYSPTFDVHTTAECNNYYIWLCHINQCKRSDLCERIANQIKQYCLLCAIILMQTNRYALWWRSISHRRSQFCRYNGCKLQSRLCSEHTRLVFNFNTLNVDIVYNFHVITRCRDKNHAKSFGFWKQRTLCWWANNVATLVQKTVDRSCIHEPFFWCKHFQFVCQSMAIASGVTKMLYCGRQPTACNRSLQLTYARAAF